MTEPTQPVPDLELTRLLSAAASGDSRAAADLLPLVYDELRRLAAARMAQQPSDHTLNATGLVHEAYLRLIGPDGDAQDRPKFAGREHFFAAAGQAMRCILVDRARRYARDKHGGGRQRIELRDEIPADGRGDEYDALEIIAVDEALKRLEASDARKAQIVVLRYFAGLSVEETAEALALSPATVKNEWLYARAWLRRELSGDQ